MEISRLRRRFLVATGLLALLLSVVSFSHTFAADAASPTQGIQVSPVLIDLNAQTSNSYNLKITVTNVTAKDLVLKANVNDFRAKDESGNPEVILDDSEVGNGFSFKQWVTIQQNLPLKSKESKVVIVKVNVPASAEAGGHYGVIRFTGVPPGQENSQVSIAASVGVLVLTRVDGVIKESLKVADFYSEKDGKKTGLVQSGPVNIVERLTNDGNVHVKPKGTITVKNMFGSTVASLPLANTPRNVLPSSTRKFSQELNKKWMFGRYSARLEASYGYTNKTISSSFSFWIIPYKLITIVVATTVIAFLFIRIGLKKYNQKIINQAMRRR